MNWGDGRWGRERVQTTRATGHRLLAGLFEEEGCGVMRYQVEVNETEGRRRHPQRAPTLPSMRRFSVSLWSLWRSITEPFSG